MALDIKRIIADAFLELCEKKAVEKITVQDILDVTGISRKTFYNHFADKHKLMHYCYETRIEPTWYCPMDDNEALRKWNTEWFENMKKYGRFMKGACSINEPDSLQHYMIEAGRTDDLKWYRETYPEIMNDEIALCITYHAGACRYIILEWIFNDFELPINVLEDLIKRNRAIIHDMMGI